MAALIIEGGKRRDMLLEFSCSNRKSIRETVRFSAIAGPDTTFNERAIKWNGFQVLRSAVIYGANGSGKSNFLDAIAFVKFLVSNSVHFSPNSKIPQQPHKLSSPGEDSVYRVQFVMDGVRYALGFTLNDERVKEEYLYYFPNGEQTKIFEREGLDFSAGAQFEDELSQCRKVLKENRLLITCAAFFSSVEVIQNAWNFFDKQLVIYFSSKNQENALGYALNKIADDVNIKEALVRAMQDLGTDLIDIHLNVDERDIEIPQVPPIPSDEQRERVMRATIRKLDPRVVYEQFETGLKSEESTGIQRLVSFLVFWLDVLEKGKVLICDELEAGLHESLAYSFVERLNTRTDTTAQLFFTTHDTNLLSMKLFRRDQIWFTELRKEDRSTDLYSLAEFEGVWDGTDVAKGYLMGRYGAIPMLNRGLSVVEQEELKERSGAAS